MKTLRLGLIGGNITQTRSPALQIVCGLSVGINVTYDLLIPQEQGLSFEHMLKRCQTAGFDGVNVTYPYKEDVLKYVSAGEPVVQLLGTSNTVRFSDEGAAAWNTDYSGFISAYRAKWGGSKPGNVLMLGTGGVGRAIAFALRELHADNVTVFDLDTEKAATLASAVGATSANAEITQDLSNFDGVINCTPLGMAGREGSPLPASFKGTPRWAFDAVYTPEHTTFRTQMENTGAEFLSGYELYFNQGVQGFTIFSGTNADLGWVRKVLNMPTAKIA